MKKLIYILMFSLGLGVCWVPASPLSKNDIEKDFDFIRNNIGGDAVLLEAFLYETGSPEQNIEQDLPRSVSLYAMLFRGQNPVAAYKLGMIAWQYQDNPMSIPVGVVKILKKIGSLDPVFYFSSGSQWKSELRYEEIADLNAVLEGIALFNENKLEESIQALNKDKDVAERSLAQLYTAFSYLKIGKVDIADRFLNKACNNPKIEDSVIEFCLDSPSLVKTNFED